jgi:hypothetical protein
LRQILGVLMETVPSHISFDLVHASLEAIDGSWTQPVFLSLSLRDGSSSSS